MLKVELTLAPVFTPRLKGLWMERPQRMIVDGVWLRSVIHVTSRGATHPFVSLRKTLG